jgi:hypothetical protein
MRSHWTSERNNWMLDDAVYMAVVENFNEEQTSCDNFSWTAVANTFYAVTTDPPYNRGELDANSSKCNSPESISKAGISGIAIRVAIACVSMTLAAAYFHRRWRGAANTEGAAPGLISSPEHSATTTREASAAFCTPQSVQHLQSSAPHPGTLWEADDKHGPPDPMSTMPELPASEPADMSAIWQGPGSALVNADGQVKVAFPGPVNSEPAPISRLHTPSPKRHGRLSREPSFEMLSRLSDLSTSPKP